jgi:exosortase
VRAVPAPSSAAVPTTGWVGDVLLALLVGGLFALSPLSSGSRPVISAFGGAIAAVGFFLLRRLLRRSEVADPATVVSIAGDRRRLLSLAALAAMAVAPALFQLYPWHTESVWRSGHGLFIPLVCIALARVALADDPDARPESSAWGFAVLVPGILLLVFDAVLRTMHLSALGIALTATGASLLLLGVRRTRRLALPLALLLFLLPLPESLAQHFGLASASAAAIQRLVDLLDIRVAQVGNALLLTDGIYVITYRCSGFGTLYGGLAAALALGWLSGSRIRTALLLASVWPLTVFANACRTAALIAFCEWRHLSPHHTGLHGLSGIVAYFAVLGALVVLAGPRSARRLVS